MELRPNSWIDRTVCEPEQNPNCEPVHRSSNSIKHACAPPYNTKSTDSGYIAILPCAILATAVAFQLKHTMSSSAYWSNHTCHHRKGQQCSTTHFVTDASIAKLHYYAVSGRVQSCKAANKQGASISVSAHHPCPPSIALSTTHFTTSFVTR